MFEFITGFVALLIFYLVYKVLKGIGLFDSNPINGFLVDLTNNPKLKFTKEYQDFIFLFDNNPEFKKMLLKEISQNSIIKNNLLKYKKLSEELNNYVFLAVPGVEQKRNEALAKQRNIEILIGNEIKKLFLREPEFEDLAEQIESELMK